MRVLEYGKGTRRVSERLLGVRVVPIGFLIERDREGGVRVLECWKGTGEGAGELLGLAMAVERRKIFCSLCGFETRMRILCLLGFLKNKMKSEASKSIADFIIHRHS